MKTSEIAELAEWREDVIVSVYLPVDHGRPLDELKSRLHSAAKLARNAVREHGGDYLTGKAMAAQLEATDRAPLMAGRGLALFVSPTAVHRVALPHDPGTSVRAGTEPDLLALLPALANVAYYALVLSLNEAVLFRGDRDRFERIHVPDIPKGIEDVRLFVQRDKGLQRHGYGSGVQHGTGGGKDLKKSDMRRYVRAVDDALTPVLAGHHLPLVVCGVGYEAAMFIDETDYRHVRPEPIPASAAPLDERELHQRTMRSLDGAFDSARDANADIWRWVGTGKVALGPKEVAESVMTGSATHVTVTSASTCAGRDHDASVDLVHAVNLALAAHLPIAIVGNEDLPDRAPIAAALRY